MTGDLRWLATALAVAWAVGLISCPAPSAEAQTAPPASDIRPASSADARAGVELDAFLPTGLEVVHVRAPASAPGPVRLTLGTSGAGQERPVLGVDVYVADGEGAAQAVLDAWLAARTRSPAPRSDDLGDASFGDDRSVAFVRGNIAAVVTAVDGGWSALELARDLDAAILGAAAGDVRAGPVAVHLARNPGRGEAVDLLFAGPVLGSSVRVRGDGYARRTASGWKVHRTGPGALAVSVVFVDARLRTGGQRFEVPSTGR